MANLINSQKINILTEFIDEHYFKVINYSCYINHHLIIYIRNNMIVIEPFVDKSFLDKRKSDISGPYYTVDGNEAINIFKIVRTLYPGISTD